MLKVCKGEVIVSGPKSPISYLLLESHGFVTFSPRNIQNNIMWGRGTTFIHQFHVDFHPSIFY